MPKSNHAERDRFAAFAFCWGDVLVELAADLTVCHAAGALNAAFGQSADALIGQPFPALLAPADRGLLVALLSTDGDGQRVDDLTVRLFRPSGRHRPVALAGYRLSQLDDHVFLALRLWPHRPRARLPQGPDAARGGSGPHRLTLIALENMAANRSARDPEAEAELRAAIAAAIESAAPADATVLPLRAPGFGVLHGDDIDIAALERRIVDYARQVAPNRAGLTIAAATSEALDHDRDPDLARAVMYALDRFQDARGRPLSRDRLSASLTALIDETLRSVEAFRHIVRNNSFDVALQPIVALADQRLHHYEALARFDRDDTGIAADQAIHFAEGTGLICDFDLAMCRRVLAHLDRAEAQTLPAVAVNVSGHSLGIVAFVTELHRLLDRFPTARNKVMFEITETARITDLVAANNAIQTLRQAGHKVCLDDFGAGAANFEYLSQLHVDVVKIDGRALRSARGGPKGRAFLRATAGLCRDLGIDTIAEMVDDPEMLAFVRDIGIDFGQGYVFGRPRPLNVSLPGPGEPIQ